MSKGIEAITSPVSTELKNGKQFYTYTKEDVEAIEKELQDLDTIKELFSQYGLEYKLTSVREALLLLKQYQGSFGVRGQALITKKLKALEIIKKKKVDVRAFIEILEKGWTWEQYMEEENDKNTGGHQFSNDRLTQEEYDLLKEVLL